MPYQRVIPRDLFNEAKLLKCLGQLSLLIHDGKAAPLTIEHDAPEKGFRIEQDPSSGAIYCANLKILVHGAPLMVSCPLNSKRPYPLEFFAEEDFPVFNDRGELSEELQTWLTLN